MQRSYQVCLPNILLDSLAIIIIRPRHNVGHQNPIHAVGDTASFSKLGHSESESRAREGKRPCKTCSKQHS